MQMQAQPINPADLDAATHAFEEARQQMEACRDDYRRYDAKCSTTEKSAHAADAAAKEADAEWRALLRANDGTITPDIQRLRKEAHGAGELRDEYQLIHAEMTRGLGMKKLALAGATQRCMDARRRGQAMVLDAEFEKIVASAGPALQQARALFREKFADDKFSPMATDDPKKIDEQFIHRLLGMLGPIEPTAANLGLPMLDFADVDMALARSPATRIAFLARLQEQPSVA